MAESDFYHVDRVDPRLSALQTNVEAVKAVASAVETTLGPKGLDTMLVGEREEVIVTNDGVTILDLMQVEHPAAHMIVNVARAQQDEMGDGTTTATLLAAALVNEGAKQVALGVPVVKVIAGINRGVRFALKKMKDRARQIHHLDDEWLQRIAFTASRENEDITVSVIEAAHLIGQDKLLDKNFRLSSSVVAHPRAESAVFTGVFINQSRLNPQMPRAKVDARILLLADSFFADTVDDEALRTESGFKKYERFREQFLKAIENMVHLNVGIVLTTGNIDPLAEDILTDSGVMVVSNLTQEEVQRVSEHTLSKPIKRTTLFKSVEELESVLGYASIIEDDGILERVLISGGRGKAYATILVSASTDEVVEERERICKDAASAVQAAVKGGYVPGGGALELSIARDVERFRDSIQGMERFGVAVVAGALERTMTQVVANAGFNPLEKIEMVKAYQVKRDSDSLGIDCDRGTISDMIEMGVVDPLLVKYHALKAAGEVATAVLRIHTVVKMRSGV